MTTIYWEEFRKSIRSKILTTGAETVFKIGDTITFEGRPEHSPQVVITEFTGYDLNGPLGMCYLPWRSDKNKWATEPVTIRGNTRHIICYPIGNMHYGLHIDWTTARHTDPVDHPNYTTFVNRLMDNMEEKTDT